MNKNRTKNIKVLLQQLTVDWVNKINNWYLRFDEMDHKLWYMRWYCKNGKIWWIKWARQNKTKKGRDALVPVFPLFPFGPFLYLGSSIRLLGERERKENVRESSVECPSLILLMKKIVETNKDTSKWYFKLSYWLQTRQSPLKGSEQQFIPFLVMSFLRKNCMPKNIL